MQSSRSPEEEAVRMLEERLEFAASFSDVGWAVFEVVRQRLGASGVNCFPLFDGALPLRDAVMVMDVHNEAIITDTLNALPLTAREIISPSALLARSAPLDLAGEIGFEKLERTLVYHEFYRPNRIERQVVAPMQGRQGLLGFLCIARTRRDLPFTSSDANVLGAVARRAQREIERALDLAGWSHAAEVLRVLDDGMPAPCAVFDAFGELQWCNQSARKKLNVCETQYGASVLGNMACRELGRWRDVAIQTIHGVDVGLGACADLAVMRVERPAGVWAVVVDRGTGREVLRVLSAREREVALLVAQGYSALNVSARLDLAEGTVRNHLKSVYRKLGVGTRAELAVRVLGGLI